MSIGKWGLDSIGVIWKELATENFENTVEDRASWNIIVLENYKNYSNINLVWIYLVFLGTKPMDTWAKPPQTQGIHISRWFRESRMNSLEGFRNLLFTDCWSSYFVSQPLCDFCYLGITVRFEPQELSLMNYDRSNTASIQSDQSGENDIHPAYHNCCMRWTATGIK